jgi:8-oxo-dGTP pyrophosphatase MutT (NUDIX family)
MEDVKGVDVLALDLEGTLISNAMSQIARPGLRDFLEFCGEAFPRLVIYTFISEDRFRQIARMLVNEASAPGWFDALEYVEWDGKVKDLRRIPDADPTRTVIVDDYAPYIHPQQRRQWVEVRPFDAPYPENDRELLRIRAILERMPTRQNGAVQDARVKVPGKRQQAAAIPFRFGDSGPEVLLVTSISSGKWILPKGNVDPGNTSAQTAETEAREEAGVSGDVDPTPVAVYDFKKGSTQLWVQVFPLRVEHVLKKWPESELRRRRWMSMDEAMRLVDHPGIRSVLERFVEYLQHEK